LAPLDTGLAGIDVALTDGGAGAVGGEIGTVTVAVAGVVELAPPTLTWKVKLVLAATVGALKLVVMSVGVPRLTVGSPGFTICVQTNGPLLGVLPAALSVTAVPATIGVAAAV
jgi:hypothetical protein